MEFLERDVTSTASIMLLLRTAGQIMSLLEKYGSSQVNSSLPSFQVLVP